MEHGKINVYIQEDYPGAEHWHVTVELPGYGGHGAGKFKLVPLSQVIDYEIEAPLFRPEYAKAIKKGLESV